MKHRSSILKLMDDLGLTVLEMKHNGRGHLSARVLSPAGRPLTVTFANTPSDWRHLLNQKTYIKHRIAQVDGITNVRPN